MMPFHRPGPTTRFNADTLLNRASRAYESFHFATFTSTDLLDVHIVAHRYLFAFVGRSLG